MYSDILVPSDGSTGSAHVALHAIELAEIHGATIHALSVVDQAVNRSLVAAGGETEQLTNRAERAVRTIERMAESHDVPCDTEIREGDPAETILGYADEIAADVIVAGTHGRTGVRRHLIGSVAERVVRHATCPVLTIRLPETDVTVEDVDQAEELIGEALNKAGYDAEVTSVERQLAVWTGQAESDEGHIVVYLDPTTQRTSVLPQW